MMFIWKRRYNPFRVGGRVNYNIKTEINENDYSVIDLGKGFKGIFIDVNGVSGVYELESGGLVGNTIQDVVDDINACDDILFMKRQIAESKKEGMEAEIVSNEEFFKRK